MLRRPKLCALAVTGLIAASIHTSYASPFTSSLSATASSSFDLINSLAPIGTAQQSGSIFHTAGGVITSSVFNGVSITPGSINGGLTDVGDGVGMSIDANGSGQSGVSENGGIFGDWQMSLQNTSAVDTLFIRLALHVVYDGPAAFGQDAFMLFDVSIQDSGLNELLFSHRLADSLNGDNPPGDSNPGHIDISLLPGQSASYTGVVRARGGAFAFDSSYNGFMNASFSIESVRTSRRNIPEPFPLLLIGTGLLSIAWQRSKSSFSK
ncbi:hypothetical protein [Chitinivorax sp. B]|uniref:hypothetical protein n=1 Tax=Chitinivorax sp. B TaxID=2502235 RepID=UPI0010F94325|nr:hypothetical protein [Chitinivorax sp. B]